jgi:hypothetical protein
VAQFLVFAGWVIVNGREISWIPPFDPFPYPLLSSVMAARDRVPSPQAEDQIRDSVEKLERHFGHLIGCRAAVECSTASIRLAIFM